MNREGKKCVLYPRVSTEMQVDGYSLEGQKNGLEIDYILVYKLSRFGRNAADILNSLEFVQSYGISNSTVWGQYSGMALDYLAPLKYALGWLMPSVMIAVAIGMFFTELTGTPIAIAIQREYLLKNDEN